MNSYVVRCVMPLSALVAARTLLAVGVAGEREAQILYRVRELAYLVVVLQFGHGGVVLALDHVVGQLDELAQRLDAALNIIMCDDDNEQDGQYDNERLGDGVDVAQHVDGLARDGGNEEPAGVLHRGVEDIALLAVDHIPVATELVALDTRLHPVDQQLDVAAVAGLQLVEEVLLQDLLLVRMGDEGAVVVQLQASKKNIVV